ncbi:muconolactone Delta-isomerase [Nonomuraea sp. NPDC050783]|uniref:muconolactone Delta-isomerase n=1 Tax=Nonomuraea sp. NPDC050783 TaxID=3154634 RepID=UPI003465FA01
MLFYIQMKWNYQGRISQDELWDIEAREGEFALAQVGTGVVTSIYKCVGQHRVIAIVDVDTLEDLDRTTMGWLPMREYLEFEAVWPLREYGPFVDDVKRKYPLPAGAVE